MYDCVLAWPRQDSPSSPSAPNATMRVPSIPRMSTSLPLIPSGNSHINNYTVGAGLLDAPAFSMFPSTSTFSGSYDFASTTAVDQGSPPATSFWNTNRHQEHNDTPNKAHNLQHFDPAFYSMQPIRASAVTASIAGSNSFTYTMPDFTTSTGITPRLFSPLNNSMEPMNSGWGRRVLLTYV